MMLVVIDTNVWLSAFYFHSNNATKIISAWESNDLELALSNELFAEMKRAFLYDKFKKFLTVTETQLNNFFEFIKLRSKFFEIEGIKAEVPKDQNDNKVLATLIASNASYLITGDKGLLELSSNYPIISLSSFVDKYLAI